LRSRKKYRRDESEMTVFESTSIESVIHEAKKIGAIVDETRRIHVFA